MRIITCAAALALVTFHALAANECDTNPLTASQIGQLLNPNGGIYACGTGAGEKWNETLVNATDVWDYKLGSDSRDPSAKVATYSIDPSANTITYNYGPSAVFTYHIAPASASFPNPGNYYFCQSAGPTYTIAVSVGPGTC